MTTYTTRALRALQELTTEIVCPQLPLATELTNGNPLTVEHVYELTAALSHIAGRDATQDVHTALERARDEHHAAPGVTL